MNRNNTNTDIDAYGWVILNSVCKRCKYDLKTVDEGFGDKCITPFKMKNVLSTGCEAENHE